MKKGEQGKLCGTTGRLNPLSSCYGSGLKDDIEVTFILPLVNLIFLDLAGVYFFIFLFEQSSFVIYLFLV